MVNKVIRALKFIQKVGGVGFIKTIILNFKTFPPHVALHLPVIIGGKTKVFKVKKNSILFTSPIHFGMLHFGVTNLDSAPKLSNFLCIEGKLVVHGNGRHRFGTGAILKIWKTGILEIGDNFEIGPSSRFHILSHSHIGNNCMFSWENLFLDSDMHPIIYQDGSQNQNKGFFIGNQVWIGARCTICKGVTISDGSVIATNSVITKNLNIPNAIYVGNKILKDNITWLNQVQWQ